MVFFILLFMYVIYRIININVFKYLLIWTATIMINSQFISPFGVNLMPMITIYVFKIFI